MAKYVSEKVELFTRVNNLSWHHHLQVANLEPDIRKKLLKEAKDKCILFKSKVQI